jgi:hypothetical protein
MRRLGLTSDEILGQGNIDAAGLMFRSTSPPGPCNKVDLGYHSLFENGNPRPGRMLKKSTSKRKAEVQAKVEQR